jgi:hypothetical protein
MPESAKVPIELIPKSFLLAGYSQEENRATFEQTFVDEIGCEYTVTWYTGTEYVGVMNEAIRHMVPAKRTT